MAYRGLALAAALALAACAPADDAAEYCVGTFEDGSTSFACTDCTGLNAWDDSPFAPAIDNDGATARDFALGRNGSITIRVDAPPGMSFPAGVDAGARLRFPADVELTATWTLYDADGAAIAATAGETIASAAVPAAAGSDHYYAVIPGRRFERLDLSIHAPQPAAIRVFEVCGDR